MSSSNFDWRNWATQSDLEVAPTGTEVEYLWVDIETTGLDPSTNVMLEFSAVLTDSNGAVVAPPISHLVHMPQTRLAVQTMDPFVRNMHTSSGLLLDLETVDSDFPHEIEMDVLDALRSASHSDDNLKKVVMAGSTIGFDRFGFIQRDMPQLHQGIHYRSIDVSTLKTLATKFAPQILRGLPTPRKVHRGLPDLVDSIQEYRFYVDNFLFITGDN